MNEEKRLRQEFDAWEKWELFIRDGLGVSLWARVGAPEFRVTGPQNATLYQGRSFELAIKIFLKPYGYLPVQRINCIHCEAPLAEKLEERHTPDFLSYGDGLSDTFRTTNFACSACHRVTCVASFDDSTLFFPI